MRILFDHNLPRPLRRALSGHLVELSAERGWAELKDGVLLRTAEAAGFDLITTADQNIKYQQNLKELQHSSNRPGRESVEICARTSAGDSLRRE
jgi:predicted nuclease of predicted toxin-antitoxin system